MPIQLALHSWPSLLEPRDAAANEVLIYYANTSNPDKLHIKPDGRLCLAAFNVL